MKKAVRIGILEELVNRLPDFLEPMSEEELRLWEGDLLEFQAGDKDKNSRTDRAAILDDSTGSGSA
ncbi:hypothetical protein [Paracoccus fontiphilus]|uniref:Addiction module component, TIGR02574 family n=1 Tax=Paracoccus fontiphilus TaxID=1815556 RepID=A0ABV7I983_9RHOB|nr:hypothetical protein [Paracoccus fontiphilus]